MKAKSFKISCTGLATKGVDIIGVYFKDGRVHYDKHGKYRYSGSINRVVALDKKGKIVDQVDLRTTTGTTK